MARQVKSFKRNKKLKNHRDHRTVRKYVDPMAKEHKKKKERLQIKEIENELSGL